MVTESTVLLLISDDEMRIVVQAVKRSSDKQAVYEARDTPQLWIMVAMETQDL